MSRQPLSKRLSLLDVPLELPPPPDVSGPRLPPLPPLQLSGAAVQASGTPLVSPRPSTPGAREVGEAHARRRRVEALVGSACVSPSILRRAPIPPPVAPLPSSGRERGRVIRGRGTRGTAVRGRTVAREGSTPAPRLPPPPLEGTRAHTEGVHSRSRAATSLPPPPQPLPPPPPSLAPIAPDSIVAAAADAAADAHLPPPLPPGSPAVVRCVRSDAAVAQLEQLRHRGRRAYPLVDVERLPHVGATGPLAGIAAWEASGDLAADLEQYAALYFRGGAGKGKGSKRASKLRACHSHQAKRLKAPLHALASKEQQKLALEVFERLLVFGGEKHEKRLSVSALLHTDPLVSCAQHVLDVCMRCPPLRDELYAQLLKQLTKNPREESRARMREMLLFAVCSFPPSSADMLQVLWRYLERRKGWFVFQCLQRTCTRTKERTRAPSLLELMFLRQRSSLICRFALADGTQKAVQVDSSSRMEEAFHSFCERVGIAYCWRDVLQPLLVTPDGEEVEVPLEALVSDTLRNCELVLAMSSGALQPSFAFRVQAVLFVGLREPVEDPLLRRLLHHQVAHDLSTGRLTCASEEQEVQLAALHTQFLQGDYDEHHTTVAPLLPSSPPGSPRAAEVQAKARRHYLGLMGTTAHESSGQFLAVAARLPFFGARRFEVQAVNGATWGLPPALGLAVSEEGLAFYCEEFANELLRVRFEDVVQLTTAPTRPPSLELDLLHRGQGARLVLTARKLLGLSRAVRSHVQAMLRRSPLARALADHEVDAADPSQADLLPFRKGDIVTVLQRSDGNDWEHGRVHGRTGNFPLRLVAHVWRHDQLAMPDFAQATAPLSPRILSSSDSHTGQMGAEAVGHLTAFAKERLRLPPGESVTPQFLHSTFVHERTREEPLTRLSADEAKASRELAALQAKYVASGKLRPVQELLALAWPSPGLQEELYCQLLAQLFANDEEATLRRCWELLVMATSAFNPPHASLVAALEAFLEGQASSPARWVAMLARHGQRQVQRRRSAGPRARLPSARELQAVADRALFLCVPLVTPPALLGTSRILTDGCTTAEEVCTGLLAPLGLSSQAAACLGLALLASGTAHPLAPSAHVADALAEVEEEESGGHAPALLLQVQAWTPSLAAAVQEAALTASAVYEVARQSFLEGRLPCPLDTALRLAVLMFPASSLPAPHPSTLELYLPPVLRTARDADATTAALAAALAAVAQMNADAAKEQFVALAQREAHGLLFPPRPRGGALSPRGPQAATALSARGVTLLDGAFLPVAHFRFEEISGKNYTSGYQDQVVQLTVVGRAEPVTLALYAMDVRAFLHFFQEYQYTL